MRVVVRADADARTGWGHVVRSQAVGLALARRGADVTLLTAAPGPFQLPHVALVGERVQLEELRPDVLVADLYHPDEPRLAALAGPWKLVCIDDEGAARFDCDLLINPSVDPGFVHERSRRTRYLAGAEYVLLRDQFQALPPHTIRQDLARLVVCCGGSDPAGMTVRLAEWLVSGPGHHVDIVIGRSFPDEARLRAVARPPRFTILRDVTDMATLYREADLGILSAGTILYEACAAGLPALFASLTDAQAREAEVVCPRGAGIHLGHHSAITAHTLARGLAALATGEARAAQSSRAQRLFDGRGCERVAFEIERL